jgi:hypothetical protein
MRRSNLNQLNSNDRHLLTYYTNLYNHQLRDINMMYMELKEIKNNIDNITGVNNNRRQQTTRDIYYRMDYIPIPIPDLESVPVVASQDIITRNTRTIRFNEVTNPLNFDCPISLERFQDNSMLTQIIGCGHLFCSNEITRWFRTNVHCPVCRYDIRDINIVIQDQAIAEESKEDEETKEEETKEEEREEEDPNRIIPTRPSIRSRRPSLYRANISDVSLNQVTEELITSFFNNYSLNNYS